MHWSGEAVIIFGALLLLIFIGLPVAFSIALVAIVGLIYQHGLDQTVNILASINFNAVNNFLLIALPLFILMGGFVTEGGVGRRMFDVIYKVMGRLPGSLAVASVGACTIFAAICGTSIAGAASVGGLIIPETVNRGYDKSLIAGTIAAGGPLGILIPPSLIMILYAMITEESIGNLFMGGIVPGILMASLFIGYIVVRTARNPSLAPPPPPIPWKEKALVSLQAWPAALLIVVILGGIYSGIATPTEVAALGALIALLLSVAYRDLTFTGLITALTRTAGTCSFFILIYIAAVFFTRFLSSMEIPQNIAQFVNDQDLTSMQMVIIIQVIFFFLGCFIDPASAMLIILPVFSTTLKGMDVDMVWFGIIIVISAMMANITPPVGFTLFVVKGIAEPYGVTLGHIIRGVIPYIFLMIITMALIMIFPALATWLPDRM